MNLENDSIDKLFRDNLQGASPDIPADVMENVLNQWQQMSTASASSSSSVSQAAEITKGVKGLKLISTVKNLAVLPKIALGIGTVSLVAGLVVVLISTTETNSVANQSQNPLEIRKNVESSAIISENGTVTSSEYKKQGENDKSDVLRGVNAFEFQNNTNGKSATDKIENTQIIKTEENAINSSSNTAQSTSNFGKPVTEQNSVNRKREGIESKTTVADLNVEVMEEGWVQVMINQPVNEKILLDWGDGKFEKIRGSKVYRHRYLPWTKKRFTVQLLEFKDTEMKVKSVLAQGFAIVSPDQQEEIIPEIITPNGDGYNDEFYVKIPSPEYFELLIFDKNNSVVFRSNSMEDRWNALAKNQQVMEGEYKILLTLKYSGEASHRFIRKRLIVQQ